MMLHQQQNDPEHCYGIAADGMLMLVCEYGCNGINPEFKRCLHIR